MSICLFLYHFLWSQRTKKLGNWDWIQIKIWFFHHKTNSSTNLSKSNWMNIINEFIFDSSINFCWASSSTGIQNDSTHCIINFLESSFFFICYLFLGLTFTLFFSSFFFSIEMLLVLNAPLLRIRMQPLLVLSIQCVSYHSIFLALSLIFHCISFFYSFWRNCSYTVLGHLEYRLCSCDSLAAYTYV